MLCTGLAPKSPYFSLPVFAESWPEQHTAFHNRPLIYNHTAPALAFPTVLSAYPTLQSQFDFQNGCILCLEFPWATQEYYEHVQIKVLSRETTNSTTCAKLFVCLFKWTQVCCCTQAGVLSAIVTAIILLQLFRIPSSSPVFTCPDRLVMPTNTASCLLPSLSLYTQITQASWINITVTFSPCLRHN